MKKFNISSVIPRYEQWVRKCRKQRQKRTYKPVKSATETCNRYSNFTFRLNNQDFKKAPEFE